MGLDVLVVQVIQVVQIVQVVFDEYEFLVDRMSDRFAGLMAAFQYKLVAAAGGPGDADFVLQYQKESNCKVTLKIQYNTDYP